MQTSLQAKLIQYLNAKKANEGFTLIELLVVIVIIGILSAVALPTFLDQAGKARQAGAESVIGAINRAQQAYFVEESTFTANIGDLDLGYTTAPTPDGYGQVALADNGGSAVHTAVSNANSGACDLTGTVTPNTTELTESNCP